MHLKLIGQMVGAGGSIAIGFAIKDLVDTNAKENSKNWLGQMEASGNSQYKIGISSYKEDDSWKNKYEKAKDYYEKYDKSNRSQPLNYMENWSKFRSFCYDALEDLRKKETESPNFRQGDKMEKWYEQWEYWYWCINIKL